MICNPCRSQEHAKCKDMNWKAKGRLYPSCTCQHRTGSGNIEGR